MMCHDIHNEPQLRLPIIIQSSNHFESIVSASALGLTTVSVAGCAGVSSLPLIRVVTVSAALFTELIKDVPARVNALPTALTFSFSLQRVRGSTMAW